MKTIHPLSFILGLASGLLILLLAVGGLRILRPTPAGPPSMRGNRMAGQQRPGGAGQNLSRIAEQLGMTEADLRKELQNGRNLRDIAKEKNVELPMGGQNRMRNGSGTTLSSSGSSTSVRQ